MQRKLLSILIAAGFACGGHAAAQTATGASPNARISGDVVKVGVLTDMSGIYSDPGGQGSVVAARLAAEDFGGSVLGKKIEIVFADHQNKADVGAGRAREWLDRDGVDMITDALNSAVALAVSKLVTEKKRVFMNTGAASTRLTNEDCSAYLIHHTYDTYALANGTGRAVVKQGGDTWFILSADYAFGHSLEKDTAEVVKSTGGKVLGQVRHPLNTSDFSSFLMQAQSSGAKIVGLANAGGDTIKSIKAAKEFGITKNQALAGLLVNITDVHALGLDAAQNMYVTEAWYWDLNDDTRSWARRFFEKTKKMPSMIHAGTYSATLMYLNAVRATGTDDADAVMKWLKSNTHSDMFGKNMKVREDGRLMHDMYLLQVKQPAESKSPWDYYHLRQTIPAEQAFRPLAQSKCPLVNN
jgi:branched-chain amino acid transport system substrate-binding protein